MKKLINYKRTIFASLMCLTLVGCNKFEVLNSIDPDLVDAGVNLKNVTVWDFISDRGSDKGTDTLKSLNLYAESIQRVGLKPLLQSDGNFTVIAPRNAAMIELAASLGYATLNDVPAAVLRNIFLDNIISERINSFDLPEAKASMFQTLNEDSLAISRFPSKTNQYVLSLYNAPSVTTSSVKVRSQNLECKNGIVHVVDGFNTYRPKFIAEQPGKQAGDTIYVTKDSYVNNGSGTNKRKNFGDLDYMWIKKAAADFTRRAIVQFPVRAANFPGEIAGITVGVHYDRFDPPTGGESEATLSVYEDANVDWNESTVDYYMASPNFGTVELSNIIFNKDSAANRYVYADVTPNYKAALAANKSFINLSFFTTSNALFQLSTKETLDANLLPGKYTPYLVLTPPQTTMLVNPINTGIVVDLKKGYKKLRTSELSFSGTTSNNVVYTITSTPTNGFLVVDGFVKVNTFTQAQIEAGAVKYLYSGETPGIDSFTVSARDNKKGKFPTPQVVNVQIQ